MQLGALGRQLLVGLFRDAVGLDGLVVGADQHALELAHRRECGAPLIAVHRPLGLGAGECPAGAVLAERAQSLRQA